MAPNLAKTIQKPNITVEELLSKMPRPTEKFSYEHITSKLMLEMFKTLKPKPSAGPDKISSKLLHMIKYKISDTLTTIYNKSIDEAKYPLCLKNAILTPLFKADDPTQCSNYRPISNLPSVSKVYEKINNYQENQFEKVHSIVPSLQFGFKKSHSTVHPTMILKDYIERKTSTGHYCVLIAIDLKKCFDTVDTKNILPKKLAHYNYTDEAISLKKSFFMGRKQIVSVNNTLSDEMNTNDISCVQGSAVGPQTFNYYVADMPYCTDFLSIYFADDTTLILSHKDPLKLIQQANSELIKVKEYFQANLLSLNVAKTVYTIFEPTVKVPLYSYLLLKYIPKVKIGNMKLGFVNEFKFLGITIDNKMKFSTHYGNVISKIKNTQTS